MKKQLLRIHSCKLSLKKSQLTQYQTREKMSSGYLTINIAGRWEPGFGSLKKEEATHYTLLYQGGSQVVVNSQTTWHGMLWRLKAPLHRDPSSPVPKRISKKKTCRKQLSANVTHSTTVRMDPLALAKQQSLSVPMNETVPRNLWNKAAYLGSSKGSQNKTKWSRKAVQTRQRLPTWLNQPPT